MRSITLGGLFTLNRRKVSIALLWHAGSAGNLGLGALTWSNIILVERAAKLANTETCITLLVTGHPNLTRLDDLPVAVAIKQFELQPTLLRTCIGGVRLRKMLSDYDMVIDIAAGDSFASIYGKPAMRRQLATKFATAGSTARLVLAPQTLGPFTPLDALLARLAVSFASVCFCRDSASADWARRWPGARTEVVPDVAFALPPIAIPQLSGERVHVGVNVSGLLYRASPGNLYYVPGYREFMQLLLKQLTADQRIQVHFVPHVVSLEESDWESEESREDFGVCRHLAADFPACVLPEPFKTPGVAKGYIAGLDILLASRLHASIAAVGTGTPVVVAAYSRKFMDTMRTVQYEPRQVGLGTRSPALAVDKFVSLLDELDSLRLEVQGVHARAEEGLANYVSLLAEQIRALS